jgi:hypothetical protein
MFSSQSVGANIGEASAREEPKVFAGAYFVNTTTQKEEVAS